MLSKFSSLEVPRNHVFFEVDDLCCPIIGPLRPTAAPTVLARWLASAAVERDHRSKSTDHGKQIAAGVEVPPDSKGTNRYFTSSMAISAVQSCVFKALAEVPTNVFTRSDCFKARKNNSICQRSLYTEAMVAAASSK
jgi:hypothetical protein